MTINGSQMLCLQASDSFSSWNHAQGLRKNESVGCKYRHTILLDQSTEHSPTMCFYPFCMKPVNISAHTVTLQLILFNFHAQNTTCTCIKKEWIPVWMKKWMKRSYYSTFKWDQQVGSLLLEMFQPQEFQESCQNLFQKQVDYFKFNREIFNIKSRTWKHSKTSLELQTNYREKLTAEFSANQPHHNGNNTELNLTKELKMSEWM